MAQDENTSGNYWVKQTEQLTDALNRVIDAWETPGMGGRHCSPRDIEQWLSNKMKPALDNARRALGRPIPEQPY